MVQYLFMGYPNRDNRGGSRGGGRDFSGRSFGAEKRFRPAEMHKATCSTCGNECEVPFKPSGDKPVYCRDCFAKNRSHEERGFERGSRDNRNERPSFKRPEENYSQPSRSNELDAINSKLDQILKILENQTETLAPAEAFTEPKVAVKKKRVSKKVVELADTPLEEPTTE